MKYRTAHYTVGNLWAFDEVSISLQEVGSLDDVSTELIHAAWRQRGRLDRQLELREAIHHWPDHCFRLRQELVRHEDSKRPWRRCRQELTRLFFPVGRSRTKQRHAYHHARLRQLLRGSGCAVASTSRVSRRCSCLLEHCWTSGLMIKVRSDDEDGPFLPDSSTGARLHFFDFCQNQQHR